MLAKGLKYYYFKLPSAQDNDAVVQKIIGLIKDSPRGAEDGKIYYNLKQLVFEIVF